MGYAEPLSPSNVAVESRRLERLEDIREKVAGLPLYRATVGWLEGEVGFGGASC
jgi:hypothetical protein